MDPRIFQILFGDLFCLNSIITQKHLKIIKIFKKIQYQQTKLHCWEEIQFISIIFLELDILNHVLPENAALKSLVHFMLMFLNVTKNIKSQTKHWRMSHSYVSGVINGANFKITLTFTILLIVK